MTITLGSADAGLLLDLLFVFCLAGPYSFGTLYSTALFGWSILVGAELLQWPLFWEALLDCKGYHLSFRGTQSW